MLPLILDQAIDQRESLEKQMPEIKNREGRNNNRSRSVRDFEKYNPRTDSTYGGSRGNSKPSSRTNSIKNFSERSSQYEGGSGSLNESFGDMSFQYEGGGKDNKENYQYENRYSNRSSNMSNTSG